MKNNRAVRSNQQVDRADMSAVNEKLVETVEVKELGENGAPMVLNTRPLFKLMVERKASDLFFTSNSPIKVKIEGAILPINKQVLTPETVRQAAYGLMTPDQLESFKRELEIDFAISEPGLGRFRVNVFYQRGYPAMVLRYISADMPKLDQLGLPDMFKDLIMMKRGLILMVGATGSGKSTSIAAMINHRNEISSDHIVTIEDPIEFLHTNKRSIVNQREVGLDTKSFRARVARRHARGPRRHPDRRNPRQGDDGGGDQPFRHRPPRSVHAACEQQRGDAGSHHQHVPAGPAQADLPRSVAVPARDPFAAPGRVQGRQAHGGHRSHAQHALHLASS